ncbi:unnamed protein product [Aphanomyces euteiches]
MDATQAVRLQRRRLTVNERIDGVLDDFCRSSIVRHDRADQQSHESKRLSQLYEVSLDDRFLKQRVQKLPSPISRERLAAISRQKFSREKADLPLTASTPNLTKPKHLEQLPVSPIKQTNVIQPWYMGHNNVPDGPTCTLKAKMKRYGARGTVQLAAVDTVAGTVPALHKTRTHKFNSLDDLAKLQHPDPWSPTLHGSPASWSQELASADRPLHQSCSLKGFKSPIKFNTSLDSDTCAQRMNEKARHETQALAKALIRDETVEREKYLESKAVLEEMLEKKRILMSQNVHQAKVPAKALMDMTLIKTTGPPRVAPISTKLCECKYDLRWKTMGLLSDAIRRSVFNRPLLQELGLLLERIVDRGIRHKLANPFIFTRDQCRELFAREYPPFGLTNFNLMYSSFDPMHLDQLDIRDVIATLKGLRISNSRSIKDILVTELIAMYANETLVLVSHVQRVFALFCSSTEDEEALDRRLMTLFHPYRAFRNLHGTVTLDQVNMFLSQQSALVDLFTDNLVARRRQVNSLSVNEIK